MASRWFIFWMCLFVISAVDDSGLAFLFLLFACLTEDPLERVQNKQYADTKRIVDQYFKHYFGKLED